MNPLEQPFFLLNKKIGNLVNYQLKKHIKPTIELKYVTDLDIQLIKQLKEKYGTAGIILDVDETLRKDLMTIPDCNKEWINFLNREFKIVILSNRTDRIVKQFSIENGIEYMGFCKKPLFLDVANKIGLDPENVLVIGDDIICDIYGENRSGMITAIVKDVVNTEELER